MGSEQCAKNTYAQSANVCAAVVKKQSEWDTHREVERERQRGKAKKNMRYDIVLTM